MESILQGTKECYLCRLRMNEKEDFRRLPSIGLEEHHIMHGTANRKQPPKSSGMAMLRGPQNRERSSSQM